MDAHLETSVSTCTMDMQRLQEAGYGADRDYRVGSPHLTHWSLYDRLTEVLRSEITELGHCGQPLNVLEVGAGHGGYTEIALAAGASVTATEMSRPSLARLKQRYRTNDRFSAVFDPDGSLGVLGDEQFSLVVCSSVLHHIPDYVSFIQEQLLPRIVSGGTFLSFQDPLWYPSVGAFTHRLDRLAFLLWRLGQGSLREGFATFVRRQRGIYDQNLPNDMVEYHVIRQGCDEDAILRMIQPYFGSVELMTYWSTQSALLQRVGSRVARPNTFLVRARGRT